MMSGKEKLYFLLERVEDARAIAPYGAPLKIHATHDLNNNYRGTELDQLFTKLEKDEKVLRVLKTGNRMQSIIDEYDDPYSEPDDGSYHIELLPAFEEYYLKIQGDPEYQEFTGKKQNKRQVAGTFDLSVLHPEILSKCRSLFEKEEYPEAVEKSFKVVRDRLRSITGYEKGSEAFGKGRLHIKGAAADNVDSDFNEGVKFLTMAIDRFKNEKSHTSNAKINNPQRAYEYLTLSSLAMNLLEQA